MSIFRIFKITENVKIVQNFLCVTLNFCKINFKRKKIKQKRKKKYRKAHSETFFFYIFFPQKMNFRMIKDFFFFRENKC